MVTLGLALMLYEAANKLTAITGGVDGLQGIALTPLLGLFSFDLYGKTAYVYSTSVLFGLFWLARRLVHSPLGLSLHGIRLNASRMPALGTPVQARLRVVYTVAAAYAGVAGALLTQTTQFVSIDVFSFNRSAELLLIIVLGGAGSLYGALLGTLVFMLPFGIEMERISLGALIIAMGMLVDNAIVVAEGMQTAMQRGLNSRDAADEAAQKTQIPLLGATVIGIVAFAPIGLSPDATGEFMFSLFAVITISLLLSWLLAITVTAL